ncbi:MAG: AMP-binding protein [Burkholderiaceae bacterium]
MSRPWLGRYPEGVPHAIDPDRYRSLAALLDESFQQHRKRPAMVCMERWASYGDLDRRSSALGAWLQARNLVKGARVAVMLPNVPQFMVAMAAILRAGFTVVNVNPLYTERELQHQLKDSGAEAIVVLENFAHTLAEVVDQTQVRHIVICSVGDMLGAWYGRWVTFALRHLARKVPAFQLPYRGPAGERTISTFRQAIQQGESLTLKRLDIQGDDLAFLQYTGGTTGLSKGAMLTHRNVVAAVLQADAWFSPALGKVGDRRNINSIAALPLYHIFALSLSLLSVRWGAHLTLVPNPRDLPGLIDVLKRRPFHIFPAVNTLFNALLNDARIRQVDFSQLAVSQAGGMAASEGTARQWQSVTGSTMVEGWGMSETCAIGTNNPLNQTAFTGTIGLPLPGIDIAIKDEAGHDLEAGEQGEICIRGPNVMQGYYGQPSETEQAFTADGFMHTGDIGFMDADGFTRIVDRKKDMILVSGFNVFPTELENVISLCPGVLECAAVGIPDEKQGEAIKLFVVRSDPSLREEDVARYCHDNLTGYKRPRHIEFRDELPKSNVGKILRRALRPQ